MVERCRHVTSGKSDRARLDFDPVTTLTTISENLLSTHACSHITLTSSYYLLCTPYGAMFAEAYMYRELVCEATFEPGVEAYLAMGTQW